MNRRSGAVSSDVVEGRFQARLRSLHRARLREARAVVGSTSGDSPPRYAHLDPATKCAPRESRERNAEIARSNSLLVEKMVHILARRPQPNHDPVLLTKAKHATVEDAYRPGPIPLPKSLNKEARTRALEQIVLENEKFLHRLIASPGVYRAQNWAAQNSRELKYLDLHCKFPYVDPSTAMPAVNPMLAIANAQSNHTAEMILRNQQALAAQMQAQQQQMQQAGASSSYSSSNPTLPQIPAAGFGATHNSIGFGSTFGSTAGSHALPPMQPSSASAVPNHFPMPPSSSAASASQPSPSPPGTAGSSRSLVPVQPHSARPATTLPQPPPVKLRAQYTSQGVRIIKTGRRGGGGGGTGHATARPATSLDPLRPAAASSGGDSGRPGTKTFQPLRTQQLQTHQRQQSAAAASEAASVAAAKSKHEESKEEDSASGSTAAAPAPPLPLFEDTLLISGRPVLVRLFEVSSPPRFEIAVFDPYSSLEYALSLPFTFVRLCFYQVPDLLLPHNRNYLVQTLLHYLVFAPTGENAGSTAGAGAAGAAAGLELLVDIVAPPPRNAAEAAAWKSVQAEAALEQQAWELANEKEAARARREAKLKDGSSRAASPEEHKTEQQHNSEPPVNNSSSSSSSSQTSQQAEQAQAPVQDEPSIVIQRVTSSGSSTGDGSKKEEASIVITPPVPADDSAPQQPQSQNATPTEM